MRLIIFEAEPIRKQELNSKFNLTGLFSRKAVFEVMRLKIVKAVFLIRESVILS
jgi:hypothetical protein